MDSLNAIRSILDIDSEGDAFLNLAGAIADIGRSGGKCDEVSMRTLHRVASQLARVEKTLGDAK